MSNLFEEHQKQRRLFPWLLVLGIWVASVSQLYNYGISENQLTFDLFILIILPLTISLTLYLFTLSIKINDEYLMFRLFPFQRNYREIKLDEIRHAKIKEYNTHRSFSGWGLGMSWSKNYKSYTIKGYKGVMISLKNGNKIFLGTQQPEALIKYLNTT